MTIPIPFPADATRAGRKKEPPSLPPPPTIGPAPVTGLPPGRDLTFVGRVAPEPRNILERAARAVLKAAWGGREPTPREVQAYRETLEGLFPHLYAAGAITRGLTGQQGALQTAVELGLAALPVGKLPAKQKKAAIQSLVKRLEQEAAETGQAGASLVASTLEPVAPVGYAVGTSTRAIKKLTPEAVEEALRATTPEAPNLGIWYDATKKKWFAEPMSQVGDLSDAVRLAAQRKQTHIGDLAAYARGEPGDIMVLRHYSPKAKELTRLDPKFAGTGTVVRGEERVAGGLPGIHFYGTKGKPEDVFRDLPKVYSHVPSHRLADLDDPKVQAIIGKRTGRAAEQALKKAGYAGIIEPADDAASAYARIVRLWEEAPAIQPRPAKATPAAQAAVKELPPLPPPLLAEHQEWSKKVLEQLGPVRPTRPQQLQAPALAALTPEASRALAFAPPSDVARLSKQQLHSAGEFVRTLPSVSELEEAVRAGGKAIGGYAANAEILRQAYGPDAPTMARLIAAFSPRTPWKVTKKGVVIEPNAQRADQFFRAWDAAGRPTDPQTVTRLMEQLPGGWLRGNVAPNVVRAVQGAELSGPKVRAFAANLGGDLSPVALDFRMGLGLGQANPKAFEGMRRGGLWLPDERYLTASGRVGQAAYVTGVHPAEAQEAVWDVVGEVLAREGSRPPELRKLTAHPFAGILGHPPPLQVGRGLGYVSEAPFRRFMDRVIETVRAYTPQSRP